jgi:hypothetical protein
MTSKGKQPSGGGHSRSAKTGQYVTAKYAKQHPATTVIEQDKKKGGKK